jgi:hypothetical protein
MTGVPTKNINIADKLRPLDLKIIKQGLIPIKYLGSCKDKYLHTNNNTNTVIC